MPGSSVAAHVAANSFLSYLSVASTTDRSVHVVDWNVGRILRTFPDAHPRPAHGLALLSAAPGSGLSSEAYNIFASVCGGADCAVRVWDVRQPLPVRHLVGFSARAVPVSCALSSNGHAVAVGSEDRSWYLFDVGTGRLMHRVIVSGADGVQNVAFHPVRNSLVAAARSGLLMHYSAEPSP